MILIARVLLWFFALVVVLFRTGLASVCGYMVGAEFGTSRILPLGLGMPMACLCMGVALGKTVIALLLSSARLSRRVSIGASAFWLILLLHNWNIVSMVIVASFSPGKITYGVVFLSLTALVVEICAGYLPAFAWMTRAPPVQRPTQGQPPASVRPAVSVETRPPRAAPAGRPHSPQLAPVGTTRRAPVFKSVQAFIRYVHEHGVSEFEDVQLDADGSIRTNQRALKPVFGICPASVNTLLRKEHEAGRIVLVTDRRGTRISLPGELEADGVTSCTVLAH